MADSYEIKRILTDEDLTNLNTEINAKVDLDTPFEGAGEIVVAQNSGSVKGSGFDIREVATTEYVDTAVSDVIKNNSSNDITLGGDVTLNGVTYSADIRGDYATDMITIRGNDNNEGEIYLYADSVKVNDSEVITQSTYNNRSRLNVLTRNDSFKTNSTYVDLLPYMTNYNELTLIIKLGATSGTGNLSIGIGNSTSTLTSALIETNAIAYGLYTKTTTNRFKITMNKTNEGYFLWTITGNGSTNNIGWTNETSFRYLRLFISGSFTISTSSVVVTGR